jgi:hypothetical protein
MSRRIVFVLAMFTASVVLIVRSATAQNGRAIPLYVLSILTDDADDQADALTQALRTRARQTKGWTLAETTQSLETLAIALKCPARPDPPCLQRIGDQLHADRYVWGTLAKKKSGEVTADLHLWNRTKPESQASETYSDNLKDPSDEALRTVAARLFDQLTGAGAVGTLVVHAGTGAGSVLIDGVPKGTLEAGTTRVEVAEGSHTIAVRIPKFEAPSLTTNVKVGAEQDVSFALAPALEDSKGEEHEPQQPFPTRQVIGYTALGASVLLIAGAVIEGVNWLADKNASDNDRASIPTTVMDVCNDMSSTAQDACAKSKDATTRSTLGWIFGGAGVALGGLGVWLITSDRPSGDAPLGSTAHATAGGMKIGLVPSFGPHGAAANLRIGF